MRDGASWDLFTILRHDWRTYTHSFNVASYCLLLAKALGIHDEQELEEIALGGLLHDVGKLRMPATLLTKKGPLTKSERQVVERHPADGFKQLSDRGDLSWTQLMMVYQHHEKIDGTGYPVRITGEDIHIWARLWAAVRRAPAPRPLLLAKRARTT